MHRFAHRKRRFAVPFTLAMLFAAVLAHTRHGITRSGPIEVVER